MNQAPKLFSPGPVLVEGSVRKALLHYDICHRGKEFETMFVDTQEKIKKLLKADDDYYAMIVSGSGTSANECVLSSILKDGEEILLIKNGMFGERLEEIIDKYHLPAIKVGFPWGAYPDIELIEQALREHPHVAVVSMVFHETSTGMINPVRAVGTLCQRYGKKFSVDAVSAAAGEYIDMVSDHIDFITSVGGKCLGAFPGSAYICARETYLQDLTEEQCKNIYLNLYRHYHLARTAHQTPNTPNVTLFWALNKALSNILDRGVESWIDEHAQLAKVLRDGIEEMGLRFLLPAEHRSNTVTSVFLPAPIAVEDFLDAMEKRGYVLYKGKGDYAKQNMFQVANMGDLSIEDCRRFLDEMRECLRGFGYPC